MLDIKIVKQSFGFSVLALAYIALVATFMKNASRIFGSGPDTITAPITFLLLLVVSAATMGMLIFGKPVMLYLDGKKREAVTMVACTISSLAIFMCLLLVTVALVG